MKKILHSSTKAPKSFPVTQGTGDLGSPPSSWFVVSCKLAPTHCNHPSSRPLNNIISNSGMDSLWCIVYCTSIYHHMIHIQLSVNQNMFFPDWSGALASASLVKMNASTSTGFWRNLISASVTYHLSTKYQSSARQSRIDGTHIAWLPSTVLICRYGSHLNSSPSWSPQASAVCLLHGIPSG